MLAGVSPAHIGEPRHAEPKCNFPARVFQSTATVSVLFMVCSIVQSAVGVAPLLSRAPGNRQMGLILPLTRPVATMGPC
jgi:hypothetical protein